MNWCKGNGGYAGLAYFELDTTGDPFGLTKPDEADGTIHSQIFPGDPPTPQDAAALGSGPGAALARGWAA